MANSCQSFDMLNFNVKHRLILIKTVQCGVEELQNVRA